MATGTSKSNCFLSIDDFNQVAIACLNVAPEWEKLAMYLNIDRPTVEGIQKERGGETTGWCLNRLIAVWLRQSSPTQPKPSWRILCDAVSNIDRPLSEKIWTDNTIGVRCTPVATAVQQGDAATAAKELSDLFDDLLRFLSTEIQPLNVRDLRVCINHFFNCEEELNDQIEDHLWKIEDCRTSDAVLNYFIRHKFIGYVNYALIKIFQKIAKSPLLDKRIEEYEKDYQCFLDLSLTHIHDAFQQCPDLRPDYPAGIPKFTIHLKSKWDGKSMFKLKEFLKQCFNDRDCVDHLMIAKISRNCIIITFAVLPHIARKILEYLTNDDIIMTMKKEGISIDISKQLMKYKEELETTDSIASMEQTHETLHGLETDPSHSSHTTGILGIKPDWASRVFSNTTSGYSEAGDSETSEYSRLVELKEDVTLKEAVDTYEYVVTMLRNRIKSLENQLVTHKQMMMELDNTRESLKQVTLERDNTRDELKKTKQSVSVLQTELITLKRGNVALDPDFDEKLCQAAKNGYIELIETLIKSGANVNTEDTHNLPHRTPLHEASSNGHCEAVNLLISLGAEVNKRINWGYTPLHVASSHGHSDTVNTLISHGATINEKDKWGDTPLHFASMNNHSDTIKVLLSNGAIVNSVDKNHQTPLHGCLAKSRSANITTTAELLISHGADLYQEDKYGNSPVLMATVLGYEDVLLSHGVSEDTISKYRLPEGWRAKADFNSERIQYTNTMTVVEQFEHPSL